MMIGETHHCTPSLQFVDSGQSQCHLLNDVRHRRAGCYRHYLRNAVQAVVMKLRLKVAHRRTHTVRLRGDAGT